MSIAIAESCLPYEPLSNLWPRAITVALNFQEALASQQTWATILENNGNLDSSLLESIKNPTYLQNLTSFLITLDPEQMYKLANQASQDNPEHSACRYPLFQQATVRCLYNSIETLLIQHRQGQSPLSQKRFEEIQLLNQDLRHFMSAEGIECSELAKFLHLRQP